MRLSTLQKTILVSAVLHLLIAAWLKPWASSISAPAPRGVVALELIESVSHESNETPGEMPVERRKSTKANPPQQFQSRPAQGRASDEKGPLGDPQSLAHETGLFIQQVARLIDQKKLYPKEALNREEEGKVVVAMTLARDGSLIDAKVEQPSSFSRLNQAALQTIQNIGRFPPIPETIPVPLHLHVPIQFRIER